MPDPDQLQTGWDTTEPSSALAAFLSTLPAIPRLLALGEPTHGVLAFPAWRNRIFRTLVEDHGFRSVALESDVIAGQRVNAYVASRQHTLDEVMQTGFSHGFGAIAANRELVEWMREFNADREADEQLRFYGFDAPLEWWAPSPRASLLALHAFLTSCLGDLPADAATIEHLCGEEARWTNPAAAMDAAQSIGNSGEARRLRLLADDLDTLLRTETPGLMHHPEFWEAQLHARTAVGLLRYHALMANPALDRLERGSALRDLMMADNLSAIVGREQARGPTLVFAHNSHLQRPISSMTMGQVRVQWWSAGAHVSARLGDEYAFIASHHGTVPQRNLAQLAPNPVKSVPLDEACPAVLFISRESTTELPRHLPLADGVLFVQNPEDQLTTGDP